LWFWQNEPKFITDINGGFTRQLESYAS